MEFYYLNNNFTTITQGYEHLEVIPLPYNSLVTTIQGYGKVAATFKIPYGIASIVYYIP